MPDVPSTEQILEIDDPRLRLLHAGARHLADHAFEVLAGGLGADAVTATAGRSRRVFYDHFPTKAEFTAALVALYLDVDPIETIGANLDDTLRDLSDAAHGDMDAAIREMAEALFAPSTWSPESVVQVIARSAAVTDPTMRTRVVDADERIDVLYREVIERALATWHLVLRPPWTVHDFSVTLRTLADGASTRNAVRPDTVDAELFAMQVAALVIAATQPEHTAERAFGDELRRVARLTRVRQREEEDPTAHVHSRRRVLESVAPALRHDPSALPSFEDLAERAGVSVRRIQETFDSTVAVLSEALLESLPPLAREARFDLETDTFAVDVVLRRHLVRFARWADANPELALAASTFHRQPSTAAGPVPEPPVLRQVSEVTEQILDAGRTRGEVRPDVDTAGVATLSTHAILVRSSTEEVTPEDAAEWLVTTLLDGVRHR